MIIIGQTEQTPPFAYAPPVIEVAEAFGEWQFSPELELISCILQVSGQTSQCQFARRYGAVKQPYESGFLQRSARELGGQWLRVSLQTEQGLMPQFVGLIETESRQLTGNAQEPSGRQTWVASGGQRVLEKLNISTAVFAAPGTGAATALPAATTQWMPGMNYRDARGTLVGNRSTDKLFGLAYAYGGSELWTHLEYVNYLLTFFVQQSVGPVWSLGGQYDLLANMKTSIAWPTSASAGQMLRQLIPVQFGVDYFVQQSTAGFEIVVFALTQEGAIVNGASMPANPLGVTLQKSDELSLIDLTLVQSRERRVDRIEVIGARITVCGTLAAASLKAQWDPLLQSHYDDAWGYATSTGADARISDQVRAMDIFRDVYQRLGPGADWDLGGGAWAIGCHDDGTVYQFAEWQNTTRATLSWIPLREGYLYTDDPPTDYTVAGSAPQVKPPLAWLYDAQPLDGTLPHWAQADQIGIAVGVPYQNWGVVLNASPNHLLADGIWPTSLWGTSETLPHYDYRSAMVTIAIESDHRVMLGYQVPAAMAAGDGSVVSIAAPDAELWVLLPGTVVDLDPNRQPAFSGNTLRILRNDTDRMALLLAGAIARYSIDRARAQLTIRGLLPWSSALGYILSVVQQGDVNIELGAPITSVEWIMGQTPMTIVKSGYT